MIGKAVNEPPRALDLDHLVALEVGHCLVGTLSLILGDRSPVDLAVHCILRRS